MQKCTTAGCGGLMVERVGTGENGDLPLGEVYLECAAGCGDVEREEAEAEEVEEEEAEASCGYGCAPGRCVCDLIDGE
jgi:hypothetical protein